jgi:hypothetical protein
MSLKTFSQFYYGQNVDDLNYSLDFSEGGPILEASIDLNDYTLSSLIEQVQIALNSVGDNQYVVSVNRDTRIVTISADANFDLLVFSGPRAGVSVFETLGFTGLDRVGASSYSGNLPCGKVYKPQFILQDYTPSKNNQGFIQPFVSISTSGEVEVVKFGSEKFMQCNIRFATNEPHPKIGPIENNPTGEDDLREFMEYLIQKNKVEFMEDRSNSNNFETLLLESSSESKDGTSFKLNELISEGLAFHYETGILKFRRVN